jgi:isoleucyl-tRNA synthetase
VEKKYPDRLNTQKWEDVIALRDRILKEIEEARNRKIIGDSLEAEVGMEVPGKYYDLVSGEMDLFKEILVVSKINVKQTETDETRIHIRKSGGRKCPRCWNWFSGDTAANKFPDLCPRYKFPDLCPRCNHVVKEMNIDTGE